MISQIIQENKEWNYLEIWDYLMRCYGSWIPKSEFTGIQKDRLTAAETDWFVETWNKRNRAIKNKTNRRKR
jgi:hypothetical protein